MKYISEDHLSADPSYFETILTLSELGGMNPEQIVDEISEGDKEQVPIVKQVRSDLRDLKRTINDNQLPAQYEDRFSNIIGFREQLRKAIGNRAAPEEPLSSDIQQELDERVTAELDKNRELGYSTGLQVEWFYRAWHEHKLRQLST
jgi:hypothetical protein